MRCIHLSQRCISSRQVTDNNFEIETTALAHVACAPQESGILLTDFAAAYPSVNHSWILSVIERTELPGFICRFVRSICIDSTTHVEFAGATRGQFLMARGVRDKAVQRAGFSLRWPLTLSSDGSKRLLSQGILTKCSRLYDMFRSFGRQAIFLPRRNHLLHDDHPGVLAKPPIWNRGDGPY